MSISKNIVLVGFMGAGKSTVAQGLGKSLQCPVLSTDELIIEAEQRPITDIFRDAGEDYFRRVEKRVVAQAAQRTGVVIDCGGGVVINPENTAALKRTGKIFYLQTAPEEIFKRIQGQKHRPLLNTPDPLARIKELLASRERFYSQADYVIPTDAKAPSVIIEEIITKLQG